MKRVVALLTIISLMAYCGRLPLEGFGKGKDGKPAGWYLNGWDGYKPFCDLSSVEGADNGRDVLRISNVTAENGGAVVSHKLFPARCGDILRFSFRARGKGKATLNLGLFLKNGGWGSIATNGFSFGLSDSWNDYIGVLRVPNNARGETFSVYVTFQFTRGTEMELSSLSAEHEESKYKGSAHFPVKWRLFGPVDNSYVPAPKQLTTIPAEFAGAKSTEATLANGLLDFAPLLGSGQEKCGWAFAEMVADYDFDYTIGAGADWWMEYYLNGEKVFDTMKNGNVLAPVAISNYVKTVRIKKGSNIFAIKLLTGSASSTLALGGPSELANIVNKIKLSKIEWIEFFDGKSAACSGNPTLIQGYPTPGLLAPTGQALFRTGDRLDIVPDAASPWSAVDDDFRALGLRIQNFGRKDRVDSSLSFIWAGAEGRRFSVTVEHKADNAMLKLVAKDGEQIVGTHLVQYSMLPADFIVCGNSKGKYAIQVNSLSQSKAELFLGDAPFFANCKSMRAMLAFEDKQAEGSNAEVVVDNLIIGRAREDTIISKVPFTVNPEAEFDPVKAGWKKVFEENFDGASLDMTKWELTYSSVPERLKIHDGLCEIACDWAPDHEKVTSASIHTARKFGYGYYEARVKFRKEHGWWSAFWLCDYDCSNSFIDSFEIDIYEDYFLRSEKPGGEPRRTLDHNLHVFVGNCLKSWNYNSTLPDGLDKFYTIGCKWTPFEISYYLDGKLIKSSANHSPYFSVTFDSFNHSAGFTPMRAILSGCCGKSGGDPKDGNFPESFFCDFVRIYEYPEVYMQHKGYAPFVRFDKYPLFFEPKEGNVLRFSADARPATKTKSPIKNVYLFDSGFLLDYKSEPPYDFEVILSKEYYDTTEYVRKGRQGNAPEFGPSQLHALCLFVQDEAGVVSHSEVKQFYVLPTVKSRPYKGVAQKIPGRVQLAKYDEGGQNIAYSDSSPGNSFQGRSETRLDEDVDISGDVLGGLTAGEWVNYTVDIEEDGDYSAILHYGTPMSHPRGIKLRLDGNTTVAHFNVKRHDNNGFGVDSFLEVKVKLPKGRHILTLDALSSGVNMDYIEFKRVEK